jgi:hypothetical protein
MSALGLGRVKSGFGDRASWKQPDVAAYALMAAIKGSMPTMFITRVRL